MADSFNARSTLEVGGVEYEIFRLDRLADRFDTSRLPFSLKILLENLLRHEDGAAVTAGDVEALAGWDAAAEPATEIAFTPSRVLLQDFTGVPAVVDLAAMRDAMRALGGDPAKINPLSPVELVIDHSVQVDRFGTPDALARNTEIRVRTQPGALRVPALGPEGVPGLQGGAAGHRHRPPDQPGVPRPRRLRPRARRRDQGVPGHSGRHRLAYHHGQRPRGCWAGGSAGSRRRPRCSASRSRCSSPRWSGSSSPEGSPRAPPPPTSCSPWCRCFARRGSSASSSSSSATASTTCRWPTAPPSRTWPPSTGRPAASSPSTRRASNTCACRAAPPRRSRWSKRMPAPRACSASPAAPPPNTPTPSRWTWVRSSPASPGRSVPRTGSRCTRRRRSSPAISGRCRASAAATPPGRSRWRRTGQATSCATAPS